MPGEMNALTLFGTTIRIRISMTTATSSNANPTEYLLGPIVTFRTTKPLEIIDIDMSHDHHAIVARLL